MTLFKSIMTYHCPRCRSSKLFKEPFEFSDPLAMHEQCAVCGQRFEPEPGFYYGAMFISYGLSSILLLVPSLILVLGFSWEAEAAIGLVLFLAAISYFKILRLSRSVWIHINVRMRRKEGKVE
ncbi:MAG: DUF983 domain-containing protein [Bacteroidota bacterium]